MRGTGTTSMQMIQAPIGAIFIWCNGQTSYPLSLARHLRRTDLRIMPLSVLDGRALVGVTISGVVLDHAAVDKLTIKQYQRLIQVRERLAVMNEQTAAAS